MRERQNVFQVPRVRLGMMMPTRRFVVDVTGACERLSGEPVSSDTLFERFRASFERMCLERRDEFWRCLDKLRRHCCGGMKDRGGFRRFLIDSGFSLSEEIRDGGFTADARPED